MIGGSIGLQLSTVRSLAVICSCRTWAKHDGIPSSSTKMRRNTGSGRLSHQFL